MKKILTQILIKRKQRRFLVIFINGIINIMIIYVITNFSIK